MREHEANFQLFCIVFLPKIIRIMQQFSFGFNQKLSGEATTGHVDWNSGPISSFIHFHLPGHPTQHQRGLQMVHGVLSVHRLSPAGQSLRFVVYDAAKERLAIHAQHAQQKKKLTVFQLNLGPKIWSAGLDPKTSEDKIYAYKLWGLG